MSMTEIRQAGTEPFTLHIPPPRLMTPQEQAELYRKALQQDPASLEIRYRVADQLLYLDRFEEALALLREWDSDDFAFLILEAEALLSRETPEGNLLCEETARRALDAAGNDAKRASALAVLGKAQVRLGRPEEARATLERALACDRKDKDSFKRVANLALADRRPEEVLTRVDALVSDGVAHSRVVASQSLAFAQQGRLDEARASQGLNRFLRQFDPAPPESWSTLAAFTAELARELAAHPGIRYGRYGLASTRSWRIDDPALKRLRIFPELQQLVRREVLRYVAELPESGHPFLAGRLADAELRNWCVVTEEDGHEEWHVHQNGWISGTFYIQVPDHVVSGTGNGGCIAFGLPEEIVGQEQARQFGEVLCRPHAGLMTIFPSHTFHRTYPHGGEGRRICYAFDVVERRGPSPA